MGALDPDVVELDASIGLYFNTRLNAPNVWEFEVDTEIIDEARRIFEDGEPFAHLARGGRPFESVTTASGGFFVARSAELLSWASDVAWVSVDDDASFIRFRDIFKRLGISERFAHLVPDIRKQLGPEPPRLLSSPCACSC